MLITPHQVAIYSDRLDTVTPTMQPKATRWTWIAGRRYKAVGRL